MKIAFTNCQTCCYQKTVRINSVITRILKSGRFHQELEIKDRSENRIYKDMCEELESKLLNEQLIKIEFNPPYTQCHGYSTKYNLAFLLSMTNVL